MTAATTTATTGLQRRHEAAARLLHIDPTTALRTLDGLERPPHGAPDSDVFQDALALRLVASSMLGLEGEAVQHARKLKSAGLTARSRMTVARWLLTYAGNRAALASPLIDGGCGRPHCDHDAGTEMALNAILHAGDTADRLQAAEAFASIDADDPTFKLAQAKVLHGAGRTRDATDYLASLNDPRMRRAAGILLYATGEFDAAVPLLSGVATLEAAARLGASLVHGVADGAPVPPELADEPALRAIFLEAAGRWEEAAKAWTAAERPMQAWEASLLAGSPGRPVEGAEATWRWRYYAMTGKLRPGEEPASEAEHQYAAIGRARRLVTRLRRGDRPALRRDEADQFRLSGLLRLVAKGHEDAVATAQQLMTLEPPARPLEILPALAQLQSVDGGMPTAERREAWSAWLQAHPAPQLPGPDAARTALLGKTLAGDDAPAAKQLSSELAELSPATMVAGVGVALAKGWTITSELAASILAPETLAACLQDPNVELLPTIVLLAGAAEVPDDQRRIAAEIAGALIAQTQARGAVSKAAGRKAAEVVKAAIAEIGPVDEVVGPIAAYELELRWADGRRSVLAGPLLASRAGMDAAAAGVPRGSKARYYGPLGRARILAEDGRLESALALAEAATDAADDEREDVISEMRAALAERLATVGQIDRAIELVTAAAPSGEEAAAAVARKIIDGLEEARYDSAASKLRRLHEAFPDQQVVAVSYADVLNRRAVKGLNAERPLQGLMQDLRLAMELDPDDLAIRSNLAWCHIQLAMKSFQRNPDGALSEIRRAQKLAPNDSDNARFGSQVAMAAGAQLVKRKRNADAQDAVHLALQLDPSNEEARKIGAMFMLR